MIYFWEIGDYVANKWITMHDKTGIDHYDFFDCKYVEPTEAFRIESEKEMAFWDRRPYIPSSTGHPIVTMEMAERLAPILGDSAQLYPVEMRCPDGIREARLINPLHCVDAVDWDGAEAEFWEDEPDNVRRLKKLRLRPDALGDYPIGRLSEFFPLVLASSQLKEMFKFTKMCEFKFDYQMYG